jgi:hypothetical protein
MQSLLDGGTGWPTNSCMRGVDRSPSKSQLCRSRPGHSGQEWPYGSPQSNPLAGGRLPFQIGERTRLAVTQSCRDRRRALANPPALLGLGLGLPCAPGAASTSVLGSACVTGSAGRSRYAHSEGPAESVPTPNQATRCDWEMARSAAIANRSAPSPGVHIALAVICRSHTAPPDMTARNCSSALTPGSPSVAPC